MGPPLFVRCISRHSQSHASNVSAPTMSLPGPEQHTSGLLIPTPTTLLLLCFTGENRQANCALRPPSCAAIARTWLLALRETLQIPPLISKSFGRLLRLSHVATRHSNSCAGGKWNFVRRFGHIFDNNHRDLYIKCLR